MRSQRLLPRIHLQPDYVDSLPAPGRGQFHAGHKADAGLVTGGLRRVEAIDGVVIGERQRAHAARPGPCDQLGRREHAIGVMAVRMEVDQDFGGLVHAGPV